MVKQRHRQLPLPISLRSWPSCVIVFNNCSERTHVCVKSKDMAKKGRGRGNTPGICPHHLSILCRCIAQPQTVHWTWAQSSRHARSVRIFASHGDIHSKSWRVRARYGLRAIRVGEATHPGPPGDEPINDVVKALERDLGGVQPICTQVDTSCDSNRFFCLTDDCGHSDADAEATLSDTESVRSPRGEGEG